MQTKLWSKNIKSRAKNTKRQLLVDLDSNDEVTIKDLLLLGFQIGTSSCSLVQPTASFLCD